MSLALQGDLKNKRVTTSYITANDYYDFASRGSGIGTITVQGLATAVKQSFNL